MRWVQYSSVYHDFVWFKPEIINLQQHTFSFKAITCQCCWHGPEGLLRVQYLSSPAQNLKVKTFALVQSCLFSCEFLPALPNLKLNLQSGPNWHFHWALLWICVKCHHFWWQTRACHWCRLSCQLVWQCCHVALWWIYMLKSRSWGRVRDQHITLWFSVINVARSQTPSKQYFVSSSVVMCKKFENNAIIAMVRI